MRDYTEQELVRREKADKLKSLGLDPYGHRYERSDYALDIKERYQDIEHDAFETMSDMAKVAGRIMFIRKMGKAVPSKYIFLLMMLVKKHMICLKVLILAIL